MNQNESKLHFFARCREVLRRKHRRPFHQLERPPAAERLEPRLAPSVTGMVSGTNVNLSGDGASDNYTFGVDGSGNLTHTFPTGAGAGMFASADDFDSTQPGTQSVKADSKLSVKITDSGGVDTVSFEGMPNGMTMSARKNFGGAQSSNGTFSFTDIESIGGSAKDDKLTYVTQPGETISIGGGDGNDSIDVSGGGSSAIDGGAGDDKLSGRTKIGATISGGDGNDTITSGANDVLIDGGKDNDSISVTSGKKAVVNVDGGDGNDTLTGGAAPSTFMGGMGNDVINGGKGDERIDGGEGDDTINSGKGKDSITTGMGNDKVSTTREGRVIEQGGSFSLSNGSLGQDLGVGGTFTDVHVNVMHVSLTGDSGPNTLEASKFSGTLTLNGAGGDDSLFGGTGPNLLDGGPGNDIIFGGPGSKDIFGANLLGGGTYKLNDISGSGADQGTDKFSSIEGAIINVMDGTPVFIDTFLFSLGNVTLNGGGGDDTFATGSGNDLAFGNGGNDLLFINAGNDKFDGGLGDDAVSGDFLPNGLTATGSDLRGTITSKFPVSGGGTVTQKTRTTSVNEILGTPGDDIFRMSVSKNGILIIDGGDGNDQITVAGAGVATIFGGFGNDKLKATAGKFRDHQMFGGDGDDTITAGGAGGAFLFGDKGKDRLINNGFGGLDGGDGDDTLISGGRGNDLNGGDGADLLRGGGGNDFVNTADGTGTDTADGGPGNDILIGSDPGDQTTGFP